MTTISLHNLTERLKSGYMILTGEYGRKYRNQALLVPNYGWVPCSRKLQNNFTGQAEIPVHRFWEKC